MPMWPHPIRAIRMHVRLLRGRDPRGCHDGRSAPGHAPPNAARPTASSPEPGPDRVHRALERGPLRRRRRDRVVEVEPALDRAGLRRAGTRSHRAGGRPPRGPRRRAGPGRPSAIIAATSVGSGSVLGAGDRREVVEAHLELHRPRRGARGRRRRAATRSAIRTTSCSSRARSAQSTGEGLLVPDRLGGSLGLDRARVAVPGAGVQLGAERGPERRDEGGLAGCRRGRRW